MTGERRRPANSPLVAAVAVGQDDPVVFPGQTGRSHNHTYVGNRSINAATTPTALLGGRSRCESESDSSAYWMPTLSVGQNDVTPLTTIVYYVNRSRERTSAPPKGLVMIAGNGDARSRQPKGIVAWSCGAVGGPPRYATMNGWDQAELERLVAERDRPRR
jgi:hypothetical protein